MSLVSTISLCLANNVLFNVMDEDSATIFWERLENFYMGTCLQQVIFETQIVWAKDGG